MNCGGKKMKRYAKGGPVNAYGSDSARRKVLSKVSQDALDRDIKDLKRFSDGDSSEMSRMAARDVMARNKKFESMKDWSGEDFSAERARMADASRKRLISQYQTRGYAKGGPVKMPPISESVASGNRMSKENAKDMKAVKKYKAGGKVCSGKSNMAAMKKALMK